MLYNGQRYESNELSLVVLKEPQRAAGRSGKDALDNQGKSDDIFLVAEVDKKQAYVDEQVTLRVKFFRAVKLLSTPDYTPPPTPDFWANDITPQKQYYQTINGRDYLINEIRAGLFPTKPGRLTIGEARVTAVVPEYGRRRNNDPFSFFDDLMQQGRQVSVASKPVTIDVKPLPTEGKTDQFSGGVGNYTISALVDKTQVEVNEAIALTVTIAGQGNVKSIPEAVLPEIDGFRIEKSSSDYKQATVEDQIGGTKTFEYLLIPRLPGKQVVKPIVLNYFDSKRAKYLTAATEPIELFVKQGELAAGTEIPYNMVAGQTIDLKETDIRFIKVNSSLIPRGRILVTSPAFVTLAALPLLALAGAVVDVRRKRRLASDAGYSRQRKANAEARKRLRRAEGLLRTGDDAGFYAEVSGAIYQLIADKYNLSAHGLTTETVADLLKEKNLPDDLLEKTITVLDRADFGRFAGASGDASARQVLFDEARAIVIRIREGL
jgi:hypothetical protein